ncbi:MAG: hypothetical protein ABIJ74_03905 [archaeon]
MKEQDIDLIKITLAIGLAGVGVASYYILKGFSSDLLLLASWIAVGLSCYLFLMAVYYCTIELEPNAWTFTKTWANVFYLFGTLFPFGFLILVAFISFLNGMTQTYGEIKGSVIILVLFIFIFLYAERKKVKKHWKEFTKNKNKKSSS